MIFIGSILSFMKFRGQTSKNFQEVRKIDLEAYMCVLIVPSMFAGDAIVHFGLN